jgi:hypothetical protein
MRKQLRLWISRRRDGTRTGREEFVTRIRFGKQTAHAAPQSAIAAVGLGIGGSELVSAKRSARAIIDESPYRESGYCLLMRVLRAMGDGPRGGACIRASAAHLA